VNDKTNEPTVTAGYKRDWRTGWIVFAGLMLLTLVEYFAGTLPNPSAVLLIILGLIKAALIVYFFMHVYRLWREEKHG